MLLVRTGDYKVVYHPKGKGSEESVTIDFTPPFRRVSMIDGLAEKGVVVPGGDFYSEGSYSTPSSTRLIYVAPPSNAAQR